MMREILFRGKRIDNGEWVEGDTLMLRTDPPEILWKENGGMAWAQVDPSTIGQYTGLKDEKNGKRIFEGDIFEWGYAGVKEFRYVVAYDAEIAAFVGERHFGFVSLNGIDIEIIGNIHDNKELLNDNETQP